MEHLDILKKFSESRSYEEVAKRIGKMSVGHWSQYAKDHSINISHFDYFTHKTIEGQLEYIAQFLDNKKRINTHRLKVLLFKCGMKDRCCEKCKLYKWMNQDIPLDLHHINGDNKDNVFNNLMILCPNCHRQTNNYGSKNSKSAKQSRFSDEEGRNAIISSYNYTDACRKLGVSYRAGYLKLRELVKDGQLNFLVKPKIVKDKKIKPQKPPKNKEPTKPKNVIKSSITISPEEMKELVWQKSQIDIGIIFGLSSTAINNFCKKHGIATPPRGYWAKIFSGFTHEQALQKVVKPKRQEKIERIKEQDAKDIFVKIENGKTFTEIAEEYGVDKSSIRPMCFKHGIIFPMGKKGRRAIKLMDSTSQ